LGRPQAGERAAAEKLLEGGRDWLQYDGRMFEKNRGAGQRGREHSRKFFFLLLRIIDTKHPPTFESLCFQTPDATFQPTWSAVLHNTIITKQHNTLSNK